MWNRQPFNGGVNYYQDSLTITGEYSSNDPLQFESECTKWVLTNAIGSVRCSYDTLQEAMDAAQYVEV